MKIAYFLDTLRIEDGVTRVLLSLINEAKKKEAETIVVTGWAEDSSILPVPIIQVPSFIFPLYKEYRLAMPGIKGFEKALDKFKPDIIHIHSPGPIGWAALKYAKKNKVPVVATYHTNFCKYLSYYHLSSLGPLIRELTKKFYNKMDFTTCPSETTSQELIDLKIKNVYSIPWGVELNQFNKSFRSNLWRDKVLNKENKDIILYVGRLTWEKDLRVLGQVYNLLKKDKNNFKLVIAGDGPIRNELEKLMPEALFLGHSEGVELSTIYASSDIFFSPSSTETFGNATIEAMASGLACVGANAGGTKSLIKEGENGFLIKPKDSEEFYKKINFLLKNKEIQNHMKENSFIFAQDFIWSKVFDNFYQKYLNILN